MIAIAGGLLVGLETATASVAKKDVNATAFADTFQKAASDAGVVMRRGAKAERNAASGRKASAAETTPQAARVGQGSGSGAARAARKAGAAAIVPGEAEASVVGATKLVADVGEDGAEAVSVGGGETAKVRVPVVPVAAQGGNTADGTGVVGATASLAAGRDTSIFFAVPLAAGGSEAAAPLTVGEALQAAGAKLAGTRSEELVGGQGGEDVGVKVAADTATEGTVEVAVLPGAAVAGPVVAKRAEVDGVASAIQESIGEGSTGVSLAAVVGGNKVEVAPQGAGAAVSTKVDGKRVQVGRDVVSGDTAGSSTYSEGGAVVAPVTTSTARSGVVKAAAGDLQAISPLSTKNVTVAHVEGENAGAVVVAGPVTGKQAPVQVADVAKSVVAVAVPGEGIEVAHGVRGSSPSDVLVHGSKVFKNSVGGASLGTIPAQVAGAGDSKLAVDQGTQVLPSGGARGEAAVQVQPQAAAASDDVDAGAGLVNTKAVVQVGSEASNTGVSAVATRVGQYKAQVVGASTTAVSGGAKESEKDSGAVRGKTVLAPAQDAGTISPVSGLENSAAVAGAAVPVIASLPVAGPAVALETVSSQGPVAAVAFETTSGKTAVAAVAVKTNVDGSQHAVNASFVTKTVASTDGSAKGATAVLAGKRSEDAVSRKTGAVATTERVDEIDPQDQVNANAVATLSPVASDDAVAATGTPVAKAVQGGHVAGSSAGSVVKERKISVADEKAIQTGTVGATVDNGRAVAVVSPADGVSSVAKNGGGEHRAPVSGESQTPAPVATNVERMSSLQAHGLQTAAQSIATPVVATPAVASGVASGAETSGTAGLSTQASTGADSLVSPMAHTTLQATPTVLEVGVPGGTHGWLKIRAEIGEGGTVQASMSAANHAGQETLRRELPGINAFLENEHVPVTVQVAHGLSGAGGSSLSDGSGVMKDTGFTAGTNLSQNADSQANRGETAAGTLLNGDGREQSGSRQQQNGTAIDNGGGVVSRGDPANDAEWTAPAGYGGASIANGGSWLNVMA